MNESTELCRQWVRIVVRGEETILRQIEVADFRRARNPREGERVLVCARDLAADLMARLPPSLDAILEDKDLESVLSEWMQ